MYQGTVETWTDPEIAALNPRVNLRGIAVVPLHGSNGFQQQKPSRSI